MLNTEPKSRRSGATAALAFAVPWILVLLCGVNATAQAARSISQVKKVYVEPFGQEDGTTRLRDQTIAQLRRKAKLEVVASREDADAVLKGSGGIWLIGYVSTAPRSPSTTRQPIYRGFLSVELAGKDDEPLWSYLVMPGKFMAGDITKDLADRLVERFLEARGKSGAGEAARIEETAASIVLTAAGATFPAPLYQRWFESFHKMRPEITVRYSPIGSEAGLQQLMGDKVDFAASDVPLSDERMSESKRSFLHFASVIGAVVPAYNVKEIGRDLNFTPDLLAAIYLGKIRKWNDPAIRASNRGASLPDADIVVIHRSDGSGTTFVWTDYLSRVSPAWKASIGTGSVIAWPVGRGAEGNDAVATLVEQTPNSIGYVELVYALRHQLTFGAVRNAAGKFIQADLSSVTAAAMDKPGSMSPDSRVSITNAAGKNAYPISSFTWWLVPRNLADDKRMALYGLIQWMLSSGQRECSALGYAPLPREVVNRELEVLKGLK